MKVESLEWTSPGGVRLQARAFRGLDELRALRQTWSAIASDSSADPLFCGPDWNLDYAASFADPHSVFGWTLIGSSGEAMAILPFRREPSRGFGTLHRALLLADGSHDADYLEFPTRGVEPRAVVEFALLLLDRTREIDAVVLGSVPEESPVLAALRGILTERRVPRREIEVPCYAMTLPADFETFLRQRKPRMRSKIRQAIRQADAAGAAFDWCDDPRALDSHLTQLFALHGARWRAAGIPGAFADPRRERFYRALAARLLSQRTLRFARLEIGGRPVAYQIGALAGGTYYQLQEGFDPAHADQRVGAALRGRMIERLIAEGVRRYDFMAGGGPHKSEWGGELRRCMTVAFPLRRIRAKVAYAVRALVDTWKRSRTQPTPGARLEEPS